MRKYARFVVIQLLCGLIQLYRWTLSPFVGWRCRFQPTCSVYGQQAMRIHGPIKGVWLIFNRLRRCHPIKAFGATDGFTYDPVPPIDPPSDKTHF
jgi:putative membrane protein insertion efficiency factor